MIWKYSEPSTDVAAKVIFSKGTFKCPFAALNVDRDNWAFYIGLIDTEGTNRNYKWVKSNTKMTFSNWAVNQPQRTGEKCVVAISNPIHGGFIGQWDDVYCSLQYGAICEIDPRAVRTLMQINIICWLKIQWWSCLWFLYMYWNHIDNL